MNAVKGLIDKDNLELSLMDVLYQAMQNRWIIASVFIFCLIISAVMIYIEKPTYESKLLLQIDSVKNNVTQDLVSQLSNQSSLNEFASTQISLIRSRFVLEPVIEKLGLNIYYEPDLSWKKKFFKTQNYNYSVNYFKVPNYDLNKSFKIFFDRSEHLKLVDDSGKIILEGKVGQLITNQLGYKIKINHANFIPNEAFFIKKFSSLNALDELLAHLKIQQMGDRGMLNTGILELSLQGHDVKQIVNTLNEIALEAVRRDVKKKSQEAAKTLEFLYYQLPITKNHLQDSEQKLNNYRAQSGKIDIKVQTQFLLQKLVSLDNELDRLKLKKMSMLAYYTKKHPKIINLEERIQGIQKQRLKLETILKALPASDQIAMNLMRDVNVKKMLYMKLLNKIQELEVIKAGTISNVHILTKASEPQLPLPSHAKAYLLLALIFATLISTVIILIKNIFYNKIEDPYWIEKHYQIPNLAIIPYAKEQNQNVLVQKNKIFNLVSHEFPQSLAIEALRSLRTSIQVNLATSTNNIVTIMGVSPSVGKSFISSNLAYLMASAGKRVLIIDADLRKGTVHKYMHLEASPGLAEILEKDLKFENLIQKNIYPNLDVLPRGDYPKNPSELLMKAQFSHMLEELSSKYDLIIVDTAPVLMVTDAVLIGGRSSNNYLIIGAKAHQSVEIDLVMKRLNAAGVRLIGTIFNISQSENYQNLFGRYARYGQYYHYNHYAHYYADDKILEKANG